MLTYEFRVPKTLKIDPTTKFSLVTNEGASSTPLSLTKQRTEGNTVVFSHFVLIFAFEERRAMIVEANDQPSQAFRLKIPSKPSPSDWSKWQQPDYMGSGDWWTFMHDSKEFNRSTKIQKDCFELRFKISNWTSP